VFVANGVETIVSMTPSKDELQPRVERLFVKWKGVGHKVELRAALIVVKAGNAAWDDVRG
jgi:hypothetical protein